GPHRQISISGRLGRAADYRSRGLHRPTSTRPPTTLPASFPLRRSVAAERAENFPAGRPASRAAQATWLQERSELFFSWVYLLLEILSNQHRIWRIRGATWLM